MQPTNLINLPPDYQSSINQFLGINDLVNVRVLNKQGLTVRTWETISSIMIDRLFKDEDRCLVFRDVIQHIRASYRPTGVNHLEVTKAIAWLKGEHHGLPNVLEKMQCPMPQPIDRDLDVCICEAD